MVLLSFWLDRKAPGDGVVVSGGDEAALGAATEFHLGEGDSRNFSARMLSRGSWDYSVIFLDNQEVLQPGNGAVAHDHK